MTSKPSVGRGTFLGLVLTEVFGELGEETCAIIDLLLEEFEGSRAPNGERQHYCCYCCYCFVDYCDYYYFEFCLGEEFELGENF